MQEGDSASIVIRHEALNIEPNGSKAETNAFVMEARLLGRASLIHLSVPAGTEELHFHARVPGLNSLKTGSPVRITVDTAQAFVFPANE
jgi:iron(III) transport system ATP-binding protein